MTKPLALIFYESLLAGNQLINRLGDLDYRTQTVGDIGQLHAQAAREMPLVVVTELGALAERVCVAIRSLRAESGTAHIPVVAYLSARGRKEEDRLTDQARAAGATVVVSEAALLAHLGTVLDQALQVD
jgi:hypothetical protein